MTAGAPVTIASVRAHGVGRLLVYCLGKREGDWPCHHWGELPVGRFRADEVLIVPSADGAGLIFDRITVSSRLNGAVPPG
jgi:hypothetical protein